MFINARNIFVNIDKAHRRFSDEQIKNLSIITKLYNEDSQAYFDLLKEYENNYTTATAQSEIDYWHLQIEWLKTNFPDGKYQDVVGLCKVAKIDEEDGIKEQNYSLNPGRYVGVEIHNDGMTNEEFVKSFCDIETHRKAWIEESQKVDEELDIIRKMLMGEE